MKITRNTNKAQLKTLLQNNFVAVKKADKALADSITYASEQEKKDPKSVKKADLVDLVQQVATLLGDKFNEAMTPAPVVAVENSVKPAAKLSKSTKKDDKTGVKKDTEKKPAAKKLKDNDNKPDYVTAENFPEELKVGDNTYELAHDIQSMESLLKAYADEQDIVFAFYWSAKRLRQYNYAGGTVTKPDSFPDDLDLATCLYVSDEGKVSYMLSMYTESMYCVLPDEFDEFDDGTRASRGIEYQIYRAR